MAIRRLSGESEAGPLTVAVHEPTARAHVYNDGDGTISVINAIPETVEATIDLIFGDGFDAPFRDHSIAGRGTRSGSRGTGE